MIPIFKVYLLLHFSSFSKLFIFLTCYKSLQHLINDYILLVCIYSSPQNLKKQVKLMIVTKQRRQSHSGYQVNNYSYTPFQQQKQNLFKTSNKPTNFVEKQTAFKRQRNSIGSVLKVNKNNYSNINQSCKKSQKKYDYSSTFEQDNYRQTLNKTQNKIEYKDRNSIGERDKINNSYHFQQEKERKRCNSVKNSIPKYKYTDNYLLNQQKAQQIPQSYIKPSNSLNKYNNRNCQVSQNPKYNSTQKLTTQNYQFKSNKENRPSNVRKFFANDKYQDNLDCTEKFIQFRTQQKLTNIQDQKSNTKYQPKYSRMRNNKRSQIINKSHQYLQDKTQLHQQNLDQTNKTSNLVNFEQLYKNSQIQNKKISQKIHRITQLNTEINRRLQKMLMTKKIH